MRRNNKALYELIMRNVSREVKKALNESSRYNNDRYYYVLQLESEGYDPREPGLSHSGHFGPYNSLDEAKANAEIIKKKVIDDMVQETIDDGDEPDLREIESWYFYKVVSEEKLLNLIGYLYSRSLEKMRNAAKLYLNNIGLKL